MFTGIGGFELGIGDKGECIGFSEIDKYASQLLSVKWPTVKNYGDATLIDERQLPNFDLLVGGFPCQSFSIAGKRKGFDDTRGTLFFDIARILSYKKPSYLVLENVKGLLSHDGGATFQTILGVLTDLGYVVQWQVLNSKNFGVPQNRERVFIVGHLRGTPRPQVFPVGGESKKDIRRTGEEISYSIDANYAKGTNTVMKSRRQIIKVSGDVDKRKTYLGDIASTLAANPTSDNTARALIEGKIRRLTPLECERLQGFPDNWTKDFSDTQRYKMCGNAVTVNVVRAVVNYFLL